jgi:uncharacterized membrane protein
MLETMAAAIRRRFRMLPRKYADLVGLSALALLAIIIVATGLQRTILGVLVGIPLVLFVPGYSVAEAALQNRERSFTERLLVGIGLSLAIVVLSGIALDWMPWGLQPLSWALLLAGITFTGCLIAARRRRDISQTGVVPVITVPLEPGLHLAIWPKILAGLAALLVLGSLGIAVYGAQNQPYDGFVQLWALPPAQGDTTSAIHFGIRNQDKTPEEYELHITVNGRTVQNYPVVLLQPQATWQQSLALHVKTPRTHVILTLYNADQPGTVIRSVSLWLGGQ